jgi:monoterpene epsilon-lactone hydrolase
MNSVSRYTVLSLLIASAALGAQQPALQPTTAAEAPTRDTSYIDDQGTAHVTRLIPVPRDISPKAQLILSRGEPDQGQSDPPLSERRSRMDAYTAAARVAWSKLCPNQIVEDKIAGVPVRIVTPDGMPETNRDKVLLNVHGGGFNTDSGSYTESIPIAGYTKIKVVAVLYRLAPEHPFPAAVDDTVAVYKELLKTYKPEHIVIYGTSAGAILTPEVAVRLKQLGLPLPAALGIFSGMGDFTHPGDSRSLFALGGWTGHLDPPSFAQHNFQGTGIVEVNTGYSELDNYAGQTDPKDPVLSPIYADLHGMPPSLFMTSGRDQMFSGTVNLHRAFLIAGVDVRLVVYDALPHAFWYNPDPEFPESIEANHIIADFFVKQLNK